MWLSRSVIVIVALVTLGACGFRPLYGTRETGDTRREFALIEVAAMQDRSGQILRNHLEHALHPQGRAARPRYRLSATLRESKASLAVRKTALATRANLTLSVNFVLRSAAGGQTLYGAISRIIVSYNILDSEFATLAAEKDARKRALKELSEDIRIRLGAYFERPPVNGNLGLP